MTTNPEKSNGVYLKFQVTRVDGQSAPGEKHHGCDYFVLDVSHDKFAKAALVAYADACSGSLPELAKDMRLKYRLPDAEKMAPVQGYTPGIPWAMHLEAYDAYRKKYGPQPALIDLEGRGCRGGFGCSELDEFIPGWRERLSERTALLADLVEAQQRLANAWDNCASIHATWAKGKDALYLTRQGDYVRKAAEARAKSVEIQNRK